MAEIMDILTEQLQNTTIDEHFTYNHNTMTFSRLGHKYTVKWLLQKFSEINGNCRSRDWLRVHKLENIEIFPEDELQQIRGLAEYYQTEILQQLVTEIDTLLYNIDLRNYNLNYCYIYRKLETAQHVFQKEDKAHVLDWCLKLANLHIINSNICQNLIAVEFVNNYVKQGPESIVDNLKKYFENPKNLENNKILQDTGTFYYWLFTECAYKN